MEVETFRQAGLVLGDLIEYTLDEGSSILNKAGYFCAENPICVFIADNITAGISLADNIIPLKKIQGVRKPIRFLENISPSKINYSNLIELVFNTDKKVSVRPAYFLRYSKGIIEVSTAFRGKSRLDCRGYDLQKEQLRIRLPIFN